MRCLDSTDCKTPFTTIREILSLIRGGSLCHSVLYLSVHYIQTELCDRSEWYSEATKVIYAEFLKTWIRPHWAKMNVRDVRTIAIENWLRQLFRKDGSPLANATKTEIRSLMSVLFNHAIRYERLEMSDAIRVARSLSGKSKASFSISMIVDMQEE
jgi:hypothetical protein